MAAPNPVRIIPSTSGTLRAGGEYVIRDEFTTDRAAGAVNGTAAEPGPGTRTVVDTESKLTIAGGALTFAGGKASPAYGDPALWINSVVRVPGRMLLISVRTPDYWYPMYLGWDINQSGAGGNTQISAGYFYGAGGTIIGIVANNTTYLLCSILRSSGEFTFLKGGAYTYWTLLESWTGTANSPMYPAIASYSSSNTHAFLRVPLARWLPIPLVSDGFSSAFGVSDGAGHQEGVAGGIGAGGSGVTFSNAGNTWSVSAGKAINTPTLGAEQVVNNEFTTDTSDWSGSGATISRVDSTVDPGSTSGGADKWALKTVSTVANANASPVLTLAAVVGSWYRISYRYYNPSGETGMDTRPLFGGEIRTLFSGTRGSWATDLWTMRASTTGTFSVGTYNPHTAINDFYYNDAFSIKTLAITELLSVSNLACSDILAGVAITRSSNFVQVGLALNWDSPTAPANGIIVYAYNGSILVDKCVAGVWSNVSATAYTYSAGARLVVQKSGTSYRTYYNNVLIKADTIADAGILSNTYHGLFSTDATNTFDDLCIFATGTSNEYAALDAF